MTPFCRGVRPWCDPSGGSPACLGNGSEAAKSGIPQKSFQMDLTDSAGCCRRPARSARCQFAGTRMVAAHTGRGAPRACSPGQGQLRGDRASETSATPLSARSGPAHSSTLRVRSRAMRRPLGGREKPSARALVDASLAVVYEPSDGVRDRAASCGESRACVVSPDLLLHPCEPPKRRCRRTRQPSRETQPLRPCNRESPSLQCAGTVGGPDFVSECLIGERCSGSLVGREVRRARPSSGGCLYCAIGKARVDQLDDTGRPWSDRRGGGMNLVDGDREAYAPRGANGSSPFCPFGPQSGCASFSVPAG